MPRASDGTTSTVNADRDCLIEGGVVVLTPETSCVTANCVQPMCWKVHDDINMKVESLHRLKTSGGVKLVQV